MDPFVIASHTRRTAIRNRLLTLQDTLATLLQRSDEAQILAAQDRLIHSLDAAFSQLDSSVSSLDAQLRQEEMDYRADEQLRCRAEVRRFYQQQNQLAQQHSEQIDKLLNREVRLRQRVKDEREKLHKDTRQLSTTRNLLRGAKFQSAVQAASGAKQGPERGSTKTKRDRRARR